MSDPNILPQHIVAIWFCMNCHAYLEYPACPKCDKKPAPPPAPPIKVSVKEVAGVKVKPEVE